MAAMKNIFLACLAMQLLIAAFNIQSVAAHDGHMHKEHGDDTDTTELESEFVRDLTGGKANFTDETTGLSNSTMDSADEECSSEEDLEEIEIDIFTETGDPNMEKVIKNLKQEVKKLKQQIKKQKQEIQVQKQKQLKLKRQMQQHMKQMHGGKKQRNQQQSQQQQQQQLWRWPWHHHHDDDGH